MKSKKLLKNSNSRSKSRSKSNYKRNNLKGGKSDNNLVFGFDDPVSTSIEPISNQNNILQLFSTNSLQKYVINEHNTEDKLIRENVDFIKERMNSGVSNSVSNSVSNNNYFTNTVKNLFTSDTYFNDLIRQNYFSGYTSFEKLPLFDTKNFKVIINLHGQVKSRFFKLPTNVNVVFMSPVSYISCSAPGAVLNYLNKPNNLNNFLDNPSCFNKNKADALFNQSVIYYGGQYCIDLQLARAKKAEKGEKIIETTLSGDEEHVTGIHIYNGDKNNGKFVEFNSLVGRISDNYIGIPKTPDLSKDRFPKSIERGIVKNTSGENALSLLSNFLPHFFSNDKNKDKNFTIFFSSCREIDNQSNKETLSFYENTVKYLNFKIQYDNKKSKSKNTTDINTKYKNCFKSSTIFSNDTTKSDETKKYEIKFNTISHGQKRKTNEQIKINNRKTKSKSRIKPTINDESIIEISNYNYGYEYKTYLDELFVTKVEVNEKKQITLRELKTFINEKDETYIINLLFILLSLCFEKSVFEYDPHFFDYRILDFIELVKFILDSKTVDVVFRFIIHFANKLNLDNNSYTELIKLFIKETPEIYNTMTMLIISDEVRFDIIKMIINIVINNKQLKVINLQKTNINDNADSISLLNAINENNTLENIIINNVNINDNNIKSIIDSLKNNTFKKIIVINNEKIKYTVPGPPPRKPVPVHVHVPVHVPVTVPVQPSNRKSLSSIRQPSIRQPSIRQPSTRQPSTRQPSTRQPSTRQPSTRQPSTTKSVNKNLETNPNVKKRKFRNIFSKFFRKNKKTKEPTNPTNPTNPENNTNA